LNDGTRRAITSWCRSCGKFVVNSDRRPFDFSERAKASAGFSKGKRAPERGETTVWQTEQMAGRAPRKNCCRWQSRQEACSG
jgi:hypothetical protein